MEQPFALENVTCLLTPGSAAAAAAPHEAPSSLVLGEILGRRRRRLDLARSLARWGL